VDSSGYFAHSAPRITTDVEPGDVNSRQRGLAKGAPVRFETNVRSFPDQSTAEAALRAGQVNQVVVIPTDYMETGRVRRYARSNNLFSNADRRVVASWLARTLVRAAWTRRSPRAWPSLPSANSSTRSTAPANLS
jgi:hypothetical protein